MIELSQGKLTFKNKNRFVKYMNVRVRSLLHLKVHLNIKSFATLLILYEDRLVNHKLTSEYFLSFSHSPSLYRKLLP